MIASKDYVLSLDRYADFEWLENPITIKELFRDKDIEIVQLHDIDMFESSDGIFGFCGMLSWKDNKVKPLDGDRYSKNTVVHGFHWFKYDGKDCADILVSDW